MTAFDTVVFVSGITALVLLVRLKSPSPLYDLAATVMGNLAPIVGVMFYEWQLFPLLFLFWLETVVLIPLTCIRSHTGWFFGGIAAFFCLIHLLFMFTLSGPAAHIETTRALLNESWLLAWAVVALLFEHGYSFMHERSRPRLSPVDEADATHESLHKMMGLGLIARVAALQVTLLLGLYLVDAYHSTVPALLFFLFFKGLIDVFAWGFWLPATPPWDKLRKPMGIAMVSTVAALPVWFPLGFFVLFASAAEPTSQQAGSASQPHDLSQDERLAHQADAKRTTEDRKADAKLMAERRRQAQENAAADRAAAKAAEERRKQEEADRKLRDELNAAITRSGTINLATQYTGNRPLSGLTAADLKLITDGDPNTSWTFTALRTDPKFNPKGKAFKLKWDEPRAFNKIVLRQRGDNIRGISTWYLDPATNNWQQFGFTTVSSDPKIPSQFAFRDAGYPRVRHDHLLLFNGQSFHDSPRSLGNSGIKGPVVIEAYFYRPITTKELMISLSAFDGRPVTILELEAY